jgi:hypothetical protein
LLIALVGILAPLGACGTSAIGVDICDSIETALCTQAVNLSCSNVDLGVPPHPDNNKQACIEFYKVACLHGLVTPNLPDAGQVTECLSFINELDPNTPDACAYVLSPQNADACAWLNPPDAAADADADASDAADAGDAADADAADAADADAADADSG